MEIHYLYQVGDTVRFKEPSVSRLCQGNIIIPRFSWRHTNQTQYR